jgi:putative inorganic carbon (HCO3(-)) transporter
MRLTAAPDSRPGDRTASHAPASIWSKRGTEPAAAIATGLIFGLLAVLMTSGSRALAVGVTALLLIPLGAMVVGGIRRLLLLIVVFDIALQWGINLHWDAAAASQGALGGLEISVTTLALTGLYALWFVDWLIRPAKTARVAWRAAVPLLLYVSFTVFSIVVAANPTLSLFEVVLLLQSLLVFLYVASQSRSESDVRFIAGALVLCMLFEGIVTLASWRGFELGGLGLHTTRDAGRVGGTVGSPNTAASFFATLLPLAIMYLMMPVGRVWKRIAVAAVAVGTVSLLLTLSRGGWIAFGTSMIIIAVALSRRGGNDLRRLVPILLVAGLVLLPFVGVISARFTQSDQGSGGSRVPLIQLTQGLVEHHPVTGVGVNNVGIVMRESASLDFGRDWIYTVHNKYLLVWAEAGIGALLAFLWFLVATVRRGLASWRGSDPYLGPLGLALAAAICGEMVQMLVEIFQSRPQVQLLWLIAGLLVAISRVNREVGNREHAVH